MVWQLGNRGKPAFTKPKTIDNLGKVQEWWDSLWLAESLSTFLSSPRPIVWVLNFLIININYFLFIQLRSLNGFERNGTG